MLKIQNLKKEYKRHTMNLLPTLLFLIALFVAPLSYADVTEYNLTIAEETVNFTGKPVKGMTINGQIPGPTLYFKEGDTALIHVHNIMDVATSLHWHGVLVPPGMDGVPYISFPPIAPGDTFSYEFLIRQSGTYWYHSHSNLQEQSGLYGGIVIEPNESTLSAEHDAVVVLSDWTDQNPHTVLRTLKRGSKWFAIAKGSSQSIIGAARLGMLSDYFQRELQRMPAMDISDVAYDRFLANGKPEITLPIKPNELLRLRIIDGSATTFFYLEFAGGPMTIISADGQAVEPIKQQRFLIAVAETYDVLITLPEAGAYELRATAHDGSSHTSIWIGEGERHYAPNIPKPNLYQTMGKPSLKQIFAFTPAGSMGMPGSAIESGLFDKPDMMMAMKHEHAADHTPAENTQHEPTNLTVPPTTGKAYATNFRPLASDVSSSRSLATDGMDPQRPWPPYDQLRSPHSTAFSSAQPVREIRLTLDGDMERYIWSLNNKTLSESDVITIKQGEVVRFIMINRTMMHHPMHLHGHFFRVINAQGEHAPLKHTVDVAPMSTTVIEFNANESGDWFFHCHLLYHMKSGMARVVHYDDFTPPEEVIAVQPELYKDLWYTWAQANILSNMTDGFWTVANARNIFTVDWETGWQKVDDVETEILLTWDRYINRFLTFFAGGNFGNAIENNRGILGTRYLLPLNIEYSMFIGTDGGGRFQADKSFTLTPRLILSTRFRYDTKTEWENEANLAYLITQQFAIAARINSDYGVGAGIELQL